MRFIVFFALSVTLIGCASQPKSSNELATSSDSPIPVLDNWEPSEEQAISPEDHEDLWQRVLASFKLEEVDNPRIQAQLRWYNKHQKYMDRVNNRAIRYLHFITEQIEARDIPGELALLPIVESAFDPFAYSHGRAAGVWQFIPSTGRMYGMKQDWWIDGRRDIRLSTIGALKYLTALTREFKGDWMLALAAYNSGAGTVRKAIRKNKRLGKPTDYWSLSLPKETRAYVPKLLALAKLLKHPDKYDLKFKPLPNKAYFAAVDSHGQIDLAAVADLSETPIDEIYKLNSGYNRWATHPKGPHQVLVPVDKADIFNENIKQLPATARVKWQRYKVRSGDSLISIAKKFHTTPDVLRQVNGIRRNMIRVNDRLMIPTASKPQHNYAYSAAQRLSKIQNTSRGKKTFKTTYRVQAGDSFWTIARRNNVSVQSLAKWNGMAPRDPLKPGQKLVIWTKSPQAFAERKEIRKLTYRVRNGDSFAKIANKFRVTLSDIARWNKGKTKKKYLQPGDKLTLYVNVMR